MPRNREIVQPAVVSTSVWPRRLPIGAAVLPQGGVHFRVWAPRCQQVEVVLAGVMCHGRGLHMSLIAVEYGFFSGTVRQARVGTLYWYSLDGSEAHYPDPASRFQP